MTRKANWIVGCTLALLLVVPISLYLLIWRNFHNRKLRQTHQAVELVARFHEQFNSGDLDGICNETFNCGSFERLREGWQLVLRDVRNQCGTFRQAVKSDVEVTVEPPSIRAIYVSSFEKGQLREVFFLKDFNGALELTGYAPTTRADGSRPEECWHGTF
jgi:hypothetical protein